MEKKRANFEEGKDSLGVEYIAHLLRYWRDYKRAEGGCRVVATSEIQSESTA